jgi:hypothetical protein
MNSETSHPTPSSRLPFWKLALLVLVFLLGCFSMEDSDIWWHLRTGELIWQRGEVPRNDWFTYTNPESRWIDLHWGFQLITAAIWNLAGPPGLIITKSLVGVLTIAIGMSIGRRQWSQSVTVACWLLPVLIYVGRFYVRPEMVSMLFMTLTLGIIYRARSNGRWIWLLPLVQIMWVNVQGLFVLQFVVLGPFVMEQLLRRFWKNSEPTLSISSDDHILPLPHLLGSTLASGLATLVNPYGWRGATFPLTLFERVGGTGREDYLEFAGEFESMSMFIQQAGFVGFFSNITTSCLFQLLLAIVISFLLLLRFRKFNVYHFLLVVGFAYLTWQMNRNAVLFAIVGGMVLRINIGQWWDLQSAAWSQPAKRQKKQKRANSQSLANYARAFHLGLAILLGALIVSVPTGIYHLLRPSMFHRTFSLGQTQWYPHSAAIFLKQPELPDRVYAHHLGLAAVCIYHLTPDKRIFADARLETNLLPVLKAQNEVINRMAMDGDFESILRGEIPGTDSASNSEHSGELPAIMLSNMLLMQIPAGPVIYQNLNRRGWRCVYFESNIIKERFTGTQRDMQAMENGCAVFIKSELADRLQLPPADTSLLEGWYQANRQE